MCGVDVEDAFGPSDARAKLTSNPFERSSASLAASEGHRAGAGSNPRTQKVLGRLSGAMAWRRAAGDKSRHDCAYTRFGACIAQPWKRPAVNASTASPRFEPASRKMRSQPVRRSAAIGGAVGFDGT